MPRLASRLAVLAALLPGPLLAQDGAPRRWTAGAQAIVLATRADPAHRGEARTEGYVTQPALIGRWIAPGDWLRLAGTLNLEGLTLADGELNAGISGEGFVDRRHPHTFVHELVATAAVAPAGWGLSLTAGKGFVAFGTDDPMSRPFVKYPANHHLAQLLERWVVVGGVRRGPLMLEGTLFNGDEPDGPWSWPDAGRFGDSWAARLTVLPGAGVELSASTAWVASPEEPTGEGLDQRKHALAARWEQRDADGPRRYLLAEWARTDEEEDGRHAWRVASVLAEGMVRAGPVDLAARWERTERPEEERLADPFRSPRPHHDATILGVTEWRIATLHLGARLPALGALRLRPFAEVARLQARAVVPSAVFDPVGFYGRARQWSLSVGARVEAGHDHRRMGRYGVAHEPPDGEAHAPGGHSP